MTAKIEDKDVKMLKNGSNPEGVMPDPMPTWKSKEDLGKPMVHGPFLSPPVTKLRLYLIYHGVPYDHFQHFISNNGIRPGPYTKVPSLDVQKKQYNDSFIILKLLCPVLGLEFNEEWEKKFVQCLDTALKLRPSDKDWAKIASKFIGMPMCIAGPFARKVYGPLERSQANANINNDKIGNRDCDEIDLLKEFVAGVGSKKFFGGDKPGSPDLSLYGILANFLYADVEYTNKLVEDTGLGPWLETMKKEIPLKKIFDDVPASMW